MKIFIGTSGWAYKDWGKKFFPKGLPQKEHLSYLSTQFNTVEVNGTFYHLQPPSSFERWRLTTSPDFEFSVKVSRYITHVKRMKAVRREWTRFLKNALPLKQKLGPFLFQFPYSFQGGHESVKRIESFLKRASKDGKFRMAFEFRHASCFSQEMLDVLQKYGASLVFANSSRYPTAPFVATADFIYIRLHGPKKLFVSSYSRQQLKEWALLIQKFLKQKKDVYVYFNNDLNSNAPADARLLIQLLD